MNKVKGKNRSIVNKLTKLILGIIILQTIIIGVALIKGGVIEQAEKNAYQLFHDKVANRKEYVQREMKNNWTNFEPYLQSISEMLANSGNNSDVFFQDAMPELISMLRTTQATGAYIILNQGDYIKGDMPVLYLRDYDPIMNSYGEDDIYMLYGPSELAKSLRLPLDQTWRYNLNLNEYNEEFFRKPYENSTISNQSALLGYWSQPFELSEEDVSIITYSMPLFDKAGTLRGVIGIDITLNYLTKFLPASELQPQDSLGYLIGYSYDTEEDIIPIVMGGSLQRRMIKEDESLSLEVVDKDQKIYELTNHLGKEEIYVAIEKIGLYQFNTPFESEHWYLVGIMREDYLLSYVNRIVDILWISFVMAIIIGALGGVFSSFQMTKPIIKLVKQVKKNDNRQEFKLMPTGLLELDELSHAIEVANKLMLESATRLSKIIDLFELPIAAYEINHKLQHVFVTNNFWKIIGIDESKDFLVYETFMTKLSDVFSEVEEHELNVYRLNIDEKRWIRYKMIKNEDTTIGVIMDITEEVLEKMEIRKERDHDALTLLLNRKGFQWEFEKWRQKSFYKNAALIMFDLDNLKFVNDTYGHKWGDQYILTAVYYLKKIAPESKALLGRRSGDEFILLLHEFESKDYVHKSLERFYQLLSENPMKLPEGNHLTVSISGGLIWLYDDKLTYDELLHFADEALYIAKRQQKGTYVVSRWPD